MIRRRLAHLLALATLASGFVAISAEPPTVDAVPPAALGSALGTTNIIFDRSGLPPVFGPGELIEIYAGNINYIGGLVANGELLPVNACTAEVSGTGRRTQPGIDDYIQAFADIYVVPTGGEPLNDDELTDLTGTPRSVFGALGGGFLYEPLGFAKGSGGFSGGGVFDKPLGAGTYGIVIDECQNGRYERGEDSYFDNAFRVDLQADVPALDVAATAFGTMKARAARFNNGRRAIDEIIYQTELFKLADLLKGAAGVTSPKGVVQFFATQIAAAEGLNDPYGAYKQRGESIRNAAWASYKTRFSSIAKDPPQPNFQRPVVPTTSGQSVSQGRTELEQLWDVYMANVNAMSAYGGALLDAFERYQGADLAGNAEWARRHARTMLELLPLESTLLTSFEAAETGLFAELDRIQADPIERTFFRNLNNEAMSIFTDRVDDNLSIDADVLNAGADPEVFRTTLRRWGTQINAQSQSRRTEPNDWKAALTVTGDDIDAFLASLADIEPLVTPLVPELDDEVDDTVVDPELAITITGTPSAGSTVTLSVPAPASGIEIGWDLDGDGDTDDASTPTTPWTVPGDAVVGAPLPISVVANGTGATDAHDVAHTFVVVGPGGNRPPVVPVVAAANNVDVAPGDTATLTVDATDPNGDPLVYRWYVDGVEAAGETSASIGFPTPADATGVWFIEAWVSDGAADLRVPFFVNAVTADADLDGYMAAPGPDCNDGDPFDRPGVAETPGNGFDDNCNGEVDEASPPGSIVTARQHVLSEGDELTVTPNFSHPGRFADDPTVDPDFQLTFDWGDGNTDVVDYTYVGSGTPNPSASHQYEDDTIALPWSVCIEWLADPAPDNEVFCADGTVDVGNDIPLVNAADLRTWTEQSGPPNFLGSTNYDGDLEPLDPDGRSVITVNNTNAETALVSPDLLGPTGYGRFTMTQEFLGAGPDVDQIGAIFGYDPTFDVDPGAANGAEGEFFDPVADYVGGSWTLPTPGFDPAIDCNDGPTGWTNNNQYTLDPFTVYRRSGQPTDGEMTILRTFDFPYDPSDDVTDDSGNAQDPGCDDADGVEQLGSVDPGLDPFDFPGADPWRIRTLDGDYSTITSSVTPDPYLVEYDYQPGRIRVWINGVEHLDIVNPDPIGDPFPPGNAALYYHSTQRRPDVGHGADPGVLVRRGQGWRVRRTRRDRGPDPARRDLDPDARRR